MFLMLPGFSTIGSCAVGWRVAKQPSTASARSARMLLAATVLLAATLLLTATGPARADSLAVKNIAARHEAGQTFITWSDVAPGKAGAAYRYAIYRSPQPITAANLGQAERVMYGVLNNSAKMFGYAFAAADRIDPSKPTMKFSPEGEPLPEASGLAVVNAEQAADYYYAVVATDLDNKPRTQIVPGESATTKSVSEKPQPLQPIQLRSDSAASEYLGKGTDAEAKLLPLTFTLHASQSRGGPPMTYGNLYYYFANKAMGYRDGLPGYFTVSRRRGEAGPQLVIHTRDAVEHPNGQIAKETAWYGYYCTPQWAEGTEPLAYAFTEERLLWMLDWVVNNYQVDKNRMSIGGGSMGAWGSMAFGMRHPELFASVYPNRPRTRRHTPAGFISRGDIPRSPRMGDGQTDYVERMDTVRYVSEHHGDLPFLGWCCGRHDGFATWQEQIDLAKALTASRHGFAFAWNNGNHSSGAQPMSEVQRYYPAEKFALNQSYPALTNSSIDQNPGSGDPADGDLEGGINLGFDWSDVVDAPERWSVKLSNALCSAPMTVDVTPRRCQQFKVKPGERFTWSDGRGATGEVVADQYGLVTVERLGLLPKEATQLTISRK